MAQRQPTVSVVTPSFNHAAYIRATIDSVLDQGCPDLDYMVVDGASTDGTVDILRQYDGRLRWVSEPDKGQSDAINKGFAQTRGQIIGWLNSDDTYAPGAIAAVVDYFAAHPDVDVVYGDANFIDANGGFICPCAHIEPFNAHRLLYYCDFIVQPATFFRRTALQKAGGVDPELHWTMDYELWLRMAGVCKFAYLPRVLANFRWQGTNKTDLGGRRRFAELELIARRHGAGGLPAFFRLEVVRFNVKESLDAIGKGRVGHVALCIGRSIRAMASGRAWISLLSPRTWRIIRTARFLRRHPQPEVRPNGLIVLPQ